MVGSDIGDYIGSAVLSGACRGLVSAVQACEPTRDCTGNYFGLQLPEMGDKFKIDEDGNCSACNKLSLRGENIPCYSCHGLFHAICDSAHGDDKVATKTTIEYFLRPSTKENFLFFCDSCLTKMEVSRTETETSRMNAMEKKLVGVDEKLNEIMTLLNAQKGSTVKSAVQPPKQNIWSDKERLVSVKAPEPKAVLVISSSSDSEKDQEAQELIERVVVENEISLKESHKSKDGDLVLVCESKTARDELKDLVQTADVELKINSPNGKQIPITLVGLPKNYDHDEILKMLSTQNEFIKMFKIQNDINEHFKIHVVKPCRNKPSVHQVFASVSTVFRDGLKNNKDKVIIGVTMCKVYERQTTKRCNNCQLYGHFTKECPTRQVPICGKCSESHRTDHCSSDDRKCVNCLRNNAEELDHPVFYHGCPSLIKYQEEQKQKKDLNLQRNRTKPET